jgi:hypothetical protein
MPRSSPAGQGGEGTFMRRMLSGSTPWAASDAASNAQPAMERSISMTSFWGEY